MSSAISHCRLEPFSWRGLDALLLDNGLVRAVVVPSLGGKIASLVHIPSGREWLWRNPHLSMQAPQYGDSYVERFDLGGFDECFPSVAATRYPVGPWEGTPIPDHGELWALPWRVETFCDGATLEVRMSVHGVRFPYRFERALFMSENDPAVRLAYSVTNHAPMPFPFIWSAHPIFQVGPGMKLVVPTKELSVYSSVGDRFGKLGRPVAWPELTDADGKLWDLSATPDSEAGVALKLFGAAPPLGYVALQDLALGAELRMHFDPSEVTHLGMWLNYGGWSGAPGSPAYYNVGIEPCIGMQDDLAIAVRNYHDYAELPALGRRTWQLDLVLR